MKLARFVPERSAARIVLASMAVTGLLCSAPVDAQGAEDRPVQSLIRVELLPKSDGAVARITASGPINPHILGSDRPTSRLVIDFPSTHNGLKHFFPEEPHPLVNRILMYEFEDESKAPRGRVVFDLQREATYQTRVSSHDQLIIDLTNASERATVGEHAEVAAQDRPVQSGRRAGGHTVLAAQVLDTEVDEPTEPMQPAMANGHEADQQDPAIPAGAEIIPVNVDPMFFFGTAVADEAFPLGAEDVLDINVFELEQLNRTVRVAGNGFINLPLIGQIRAGGKTPDEVSEEIAGKLKDGFVQNPQVSIFVKEFNSQKVSVLGAVGAPASYSLIGPRRLLQILAEAESLAENAGNVLFLFRQTGDGRSARLSVPLTELLVNGDPRWNVVIRPGDVVSVPPGNALSISVLGAVNQPGVYRLPAGDGGTLLTAIAQAGGLNERAAKKGVQIKRRLPDGGETVIKVNLADILAGKASDLALHAGDIVVVKESFF